jgi:hypothetical protein
MIYNCKIKGWENFDDLRITKRAYLSINKER